MSDHTARLIITAFLFIFAVSSAVSGYWLGALLWGLIMGAVALPFVRGGRVDPFYDEGPPRGVSGGGRRPSGGHAVFAGVPVVST